MKRRTPPKRYLGNLSSLPFITSPSGYRPPAVQSGPEAPLPETRSDVVQRMLTALEGVVPKGHRQNFSNGEFISSSLIIGKTFEAVADRTLDLDGAGYVAHYDPVLKIYWRPGGCFD